MDQNGLVQMAKISVKVITLTLLKCCYEQNSDRISLDRQMLMDSGAS